MALRAFPGGPVAETLPAEAGDRVVSLIGELRSYTPKDI